MTPTQLDLIKKEYDEWIKLHSVKFGITASDNKPIADTLISPSLLWRFIESKLKAVEEEIYKKWKYHNHSGLSGNFAVFMGWETAPDITVVYENGYKFIRSDKIEEYLKSNKLGGKDE